MAECRCTACLNCCFDIRNCSTGATFTIKTANTTQAKFLCTHVGTVLTVTGVAPAIPDGCYSVLSCISEETDPCPGGIFVMVPSSWIPEYTVCHECVTFRAVSCVNGVIVNFHASTNIIMDNLITIVNGATPIIQTTFSGQSEICWTISIVFNIPTTIILGPYLGPYANCDTCTNTGGGCSDITSNISKTDESCNNKNGTVTVVPTNGTPPYSYVWSPGSPVGQGTSTITNLSAGNYSVIITDSQNCTGTNSIAVNNTQCNHYLITPCDPDVTPYYVTNPTTFPDPNPNNYVGNIFLGSITLLGGESADACYNMMPSSTPGVTGAVITVTTYSFNTCLECNPVAYKISRCDDPNVIFYTNSDLSAALNQVINGVTLTGCDDTTYPCVTLANQCWIVTDAPAGLYPVIVTYTSLIYPDCDCCKPC